METYNLPSNIDIKLLQKVVYLNNNIVQVFNINYTTVIYENQVNSIVYYRTDIEDWYKIASGSHYISVWNITTSLLLGGSSLSKNEMVYMNKINKLLKEEIEKVKKLRKN